MKQNNIQYDIKNVVYITWTRTVRRLIFIDLIPLWFIVRYHLFWNCNLLVWHVYMIMTVFWDVVLCNLIEIDQCLRGAYCLHNQDETAWCNIPEDSSSYLPPWEPEISHVYIMLYFIALYRKQVKILQIFKAKISHQNLFSFIYQKHVCQFNSVYVYNLKLRQWKRPVFQHLHIRRIFLLIWVNFLLYKTTVWLYGLVSLFLPIILTVIIIL
jgi:hypothetical protein